MLGLDQKTTHKLLGDFFLLFSKHTTQGTNTRTPAPSRCFERINKRYVHPASFPVRPDVLSSGRVAPLAPLNSLHIPIVLSCTRVSGDRTANGDSPFCRLYCQSTDANRAPFRSSAAVSEVSLLPSVVAEVVAPAKTRSYLAVKPALGRRCVARGPASVALHRHVRAAAGPVVSSVRSRCIKCASAA
jgi:hypothetical protein